MKKINIKNKNVLIIPDTHLPYEHCDFLDFLQAVKHKHKTEMVIHLGDYEDHHAISFHDSDVELLSAGKELELVIEKTKYWKRAFPEMYILDSNHGSLVYRRMKSHGIPVAHIRPLKEIYDTPDWNYHEEIILEAHIGQIYLCHGKKSGYNALAKEVGTHCIQGHFHSKFEVTWLSSPLGERFNAFAGCGVNRDSLAFAYGKNIVSKPILGCMVLDDEGNPILVKMKLNKKGRWIKRL